MEIPPKYRCPMIIPIPLCNGQVYIVGHTPPGVDDHESGAAALNEMHNTKYLQVVRLYSDIIRGQFFGHWHSDTFRVIYSDTGMLRTVNCQGLFANRSSESRDMSCICLCNQYS